MSTSSPLSQAKAVAYVVKKDSGVPLPIKRSHTMAKVAAISDTVVVSATSLGVGIWQDDDTILIYQARIPEALLIS